MENLAEEWFTIQDIAPILRSHPMLRAPEAIPNGAARLRLVGKCLEGRRTVLIVDLRAEGPCALVTVMEDKASAKRRRTR